MNKNMLLSSLILSILAIFGDCVLPVHISPVAESEDNICSNNDKTEVQLNLTREEIKQVITNTVNPALDKNENIACGSFGWRRVAYLDMTSPSTTCPSNWTLHSSPRGCGRGTLNHFSCDSTTFPTGGVSYSSVCGRILAYQRGSTDAFSSWAKQL